MLTYKNSPKFVRPERKSFMSYVRNDFTVIQKILETKLVCEKKSGKKSAKYTVSGSLQVNGALRSDVAWGSSRFFFNTEHHLTSADVQHEEPEVQ